MTHEQRHPEDDAYSIAPKWSKPPSQYVFNEQDYQRYRQRFWRLPDHLQAEGFFTQLSRATVRSNGGGAVSSILPVVALHAYPAADTSEWTQWIYLSRRRLAKLSGVDTATVSRAV